MTKQQFYAHIYAIETAFGYVLQTLLLIGLLWINSTVCIIALILATITSITTT